MALRWSNFKDFSRYRISNKGNVYDTKNKCFVAKTLNSEGYLKVTLRRDDNKRKTFSVHRLVALCFISNPKDLPEVNHKDGVKSNCRYKNLEWCTHAKNIQHAWDTGLLKNDEALSKRMSEIASTKIGSKNHKSKAVYCITTKEKFESINLACKAYSVNNQQLSNCCNPNKPAKSAGKHPETKEPLKWKLL